MTEVTPIPNLGVFFPFFVLAEQGLEDTQGLELIDALVPEDLMTFRAIYGSLFERVDAVAATGLELLPDAALATFVDVLRANTLTGEPDELTFLPASLTHNAGGRSGLLPLLRLPFWQRLCVFQNVLHMQAEGYGVAI